MNSNKKLYNLFLIFVAVSMLFVSVFGGFSVADTNTEKSEKSDDNYLLSDIPDELSDEPPLTPKPFPKRMRRITANGRSAIRAGGSSRWVQAEKRWRRSAAL